MKVTLGYGEPFAQASPEARAGFIRRTYAHLAGAVLAFAVIEALLLQWRGAEELAVTMVYNWLLVLGGFMGASWVAEKWAHSAISLGVQYTGLALYVLAETVMFLPLMLAATHFGGASVLTSAALVTGFLFLGLTLIAFFSGTDFSFLRGFLVVGGMVALGVIVASITLGFTPGLIFSAAMVIFAASAILYQTSQIAYHYRTDQHVAAALGLFAAVALLFWYILQIFLSND